jgi:hypothetical protein
MLVGQFVYGAANPTVLPTGGSYYVVSQEAYLGDRWYDSGTISTTTAASVNSGIYSGDGSGFRMDRPTALSCP